MKNLCVPENTEVSIYFPSTASRPTINRRAIPTKSAESGLVALRRLCMCSRGFQSTAMKWMRQCLNRKPFLFPALHRFPHIFQDFSPFALDQFIEQPQHGLDHSRVWRDLPRLAEGFDGFLYKT